MNIKKIFYTFVVTSVSLLSSAQSTKTNPVTGINWPLIALAGTPATMGVSCSYLNYGQPYQNTAVTPNTFYTCGTDGWAIRGGVTGLGSTAGILGQSTSGGGIGLSNLALTNATHSTDSVTVITDRVNNDIFFAQPVIISYGGPPFCGGFAGLAGYSQLAVCGNGGPQTVNVIVSNVNAGSPRAAGYQLFNDQGAGSLGGLDINGTTSPAGGLFQPGHLTLSQEDVTGTGSAAGIDIGGVNTNVNTSIWGGADTSPTVTVKTGNILVLNSTGLKTDSTGTLIGVGGVPTHVLDLFNSSNATTLTATNTAEEDIINTNGGANTFEAAGFKSNNTSAAPVTMAKDGVVNIAVTAGAESGDRFFGQRNAGTQAINWWMYHDGGFAAANATGGDKGPGTANFHSGVYLDGVAVGSIGGSIAIVGTPAAGQDMVWGGATSAKAVSFAVLEAKRDEGAVGNTKVDSTCTVVASSTTLTCSDNPFVSGDVGKTIGIPYAGVAGAAISSTFVTTISSFTNSSTVILAAAPITSINGPASYTCGMTLGSLTLTCSGSSFTSGDVGKTITVPGAGEISSTSSSQLEWIELYTSATAVTLNRQPLATVTSQTVPVPGALIIWGTDDTTALQAGITAACTSGNPFYMNAGRYLLTVALVPCTGLHLYGAGIGQTILNVVTSNTATMTINSGTTVNSNVTMHDFEIDSRGQRVNIGTIQNKGISMPYLVHGYFDRLYIHDVAATALAVDDSIDIHITNSVFSRCGAESVETGSSAGGACIGNGTGSVTGTEMPQVIAFNTFVDCGNACTLLENEVSGPSSPGVRLIGNSCAWASGNHGYCYSETGDYDAVIVGNQARYSKVGVNIDAGLGGGDPVNWLIEGNSFVNNTTAIKATWSLGSGSIKSNYITGGLGSSANVGMIFSAAGSGSTIGPLTVSNNDINNVPGDGITFEIGNFSTVALLGNHIWNSGLSSISLNPAINCSGAAGAVTIPKLTLIGNVAYDTRATPQQNYGFQATNVCTITELDDNSNQFTGNSLGAEHLVTIPTTHFVNNTLPGTTVLSTSSIASGACQTVTAGSVNSTAASNVTTASRIAWTPQVSLQGVAGYAISLSGSLSIDAYPTAGFVNFNVCNFTSLSVTPGALTLNWSATQ